MAQTAPLPHLFGRFTAVIRDHANIGKTLEQLHAMCAVLDSRRAALPRELMPGRLMFRFYQELSEHFATEEADAYFGTVGDEEPSLASQIEALKAEHWRMLYAADMLCGMAVDRSRWRDMPGPVRELMTQLEQHERAESALLRDLFHPAP
ncbi:MAG TPA: hypothetical protein VJN18_12765 [Polyangiaceae bacterium]|nr:hypothetical protein [Polyangiaceae bacterium]